MFICITTTMNLYNLAFISLTEMVYIEMAKVRIQIGLGVYQT